MKQVLYTAAETAKMINSGKKLILAGDEKLLKDLPAGHWIAGTIPYFMAENGGEFTQDRIYVTELPSYMNKLVIRTYNRESIASVYSDIPENGFAVLIIPSSSSTHLSFALNAPHYKNFATSPLIGWISGINLGDAGASTPKVFLGEKNRVVEDGAVAMIITLPTDKFAEIDIVNIFAQGDGDEITFPENGFSVKTAMINGVEKNFADYIAENNIDIKLPLVADYCGAMINISFQNVDADSRTVQFYAPVFKGVVYKHAAPVADYIKSFTEHMPMDSAERIFFSCNCILNYLYSELEGKSTGGITGPITFGEIAYQLLNQTMAYIKIHSA